MPSSAKPDPVDLLGQSAIRLGRGEGETRLLVTTSLEERGSGFSCRTAKGGEVHDRRSVGESWILLDTRND